MANLTVSEREHKKHSTTRKLRSEGRVPAVVYGKNVGNQSISVEESEMLKLFNSEGKNAIINLSIGSGKTYSVMAHDIQFDRLKNEIIHIDFLEIDMKSEVEAEVPLHLTGESAGEKEGGVVNQTVNALMVKALPSKLPNVIEVDVSSLEIGDSMQVEDIKASGDFEIVDDKEEIIVSITPPTVEEEPEQVDEEDIVPEATEEKLSDDRPGRVD